MKIVTYTIVIALAVLLAVSRPGQAAEALLADAAQRADGAHVRKLLDQDVDPNTAQIDGMTALHWAAWHDDAKMARELVERGARVVAENRYGVTALSIACTNGNATIVGQLLNAGADANRSLAGGETALMTAARTGRVAVIKLLLKHGSNVNARERNDQTAVMWAAAEGHADVVSLLLEAGADCRTPLKSGFTPLFFAVREGRNKVVQVLLADGADVNTTIQPQVKGRRTPRKGTSPLLLAVENGHFELAVRLLEAGADPNDQRSGFTALHTVTWVRKPNLGDGLDGDPAPRGSGNMTSLQFVTELVNRGADVNARLDRGRSGRGRLNQTGATPLLLAADTADVPLMRLLLKLGADPTLTNADHCSALLAAAGIGSIAPGEEAGTEDEALEAVKLLLELGADINTVDDNGETAMHGAAYKSLPKMVQLLAEHGADIKIWNKENKYGWTPLRIAEGHRPGNFKPAPATMAALQSVMRAAGVEPPAEPMPRAPRNRDEYSSGKNKRQPKPGTR